MDKTSTLAQRPYSEDETEFILAVARYQREQKRKFPTFTEILAVLKSLGYRKQVSSTWDTDCHGSKDYHEGAD